jgi:hypothetical protein
MRQRVAERIRLPTFESRFRPGVIFSMPHWRNRRPGLISADGSWAKVTVHAGIAIGVTIAVGVGVYLVLILL